MTTRVENELVLCGDIGGTNSRLRLFQVAPGAKIEGTRVPGELVFEKQYANEEWERAQFVKEVVKVDLHKNSHTIWDPWTGAPSVVDCVHGLLYSFENIVIEFFEAADVQEKKPASACFAVAGPVDRNRVVFTNRDGWDITGELLAANLGIGKVCLINDFVANGYGLLTLDEDTETICLQDVPGRSTREGSPIACIGAGTGLGECFMTAGTDGKYEAWPTEGGHAEYAPRSDLEIALWKHLKTKFQQKNRISVERVVSGIGIANIYTFLRQAECDANGQPTAPGNQLKDQVVPEVDSAILAAGDQMGGVIAQNASRCMLCKMAMDIMFTTYGAEAGVAVLKWMPRGGLYIAGGIAPKNIEYITGEGSKFMEAFYDKGRLSNLLTQIPVTRLRHLSVWYNGLDFHFQVRLVLSEDIGQRGAHLVAMRMLLGSRQPGPITAASAASETSWASTQRTLRTIPLSTGIVPGRQQLLSMGRTGFSMQTVHTNKAPVTFASRRTLLASTTPTQRRTNRAVLFTSIRMCSKLVHL